MDFLEYQKDYIQQLNDDAQINGTDAEDEFISRSISVMLDYDEFQDPVQMYFGKAGRNRRFMQINGYDFDESDQSMTLFISDFENSDNPSNLTSAMVDTLYWRMYYFLDEIYNGNITDYCDEYDDCVDFARLFKKKMSAGPTDTETPILKIRFVILTDRKLDTKLMDSDLFSQSTSRKGGKKKKTTKPSKKIKKEFFDGRPLEIDLWDIERFYSLESSSSNEPVVIDFEEDFNSHGIPCIKCDIGDNLGYSAYIGVIPGKLLADIYVEYGSKVLEGNVRAFLGTGARKGVNRGIRNTINNEPEKFFTYNNGIAVTAAEVDTDIIDGQVYITGITDIQIINGGQTTATLAETLLKKTTDLSGVFVPAKITVVEDRERELEDGTKFYDEMVGNIARYANSQNKVTAADLFSNNPYHVWMEQTSKKVLAPPVLYNIPTGWYYERSRKKYTREYEQERVKGGKIAADRFRKKYPKSQVLDKEKLAMYLTTKDCKPYIVSKGKNYVFKYFADNINNSFTTKREGYNDLYFKHAIAAAILFRSVDKYLEDNKDSAQRPTGFWYKIGGYKSDIVPYSIAKILNSLPAGKSIDWNMIWEKQAISPAFMKEIEIVTKMTNDFITDSHGKIVHEYCKDEKTWEKYKTVTYRPSQRFIDELISEGDLEKEKKDAKKDAKETLGLQNLVDLFKIDIRTWQTIRKEGLERKLITYQEGTAVRDVIAMISKGALPSGKNGKLSPKNEQMVRNALSAKEKVEAEGLLKK